MIRVNNNLLWTRVMNRMTKSNRRDHLFHNNIIVSMIIITQLLSMDPHPQIFLQVMRMKMMSKGHLLLLKW
jgi:hypothetical protein